ncbi:MAG: DUF1801 domain-containing protein [Chloroflexota bacterium]|nr:DUF1801 domain-containing protein [Chloroflexota bacterium]
MAPNTMPADVERWFATNAPPAEAAMRRVRQIILGADQGMIEFVKYGTVQFAYQGDFANFVKIKEPGVNLMLMRGGRLKGRYPHLEGKTVKRMRFADLKEVNARAAELRAMVKEWCALGSA